MKPWVPAQVLYRKRKRKTQTLMPRGRGRMEKLLPRPQGSQTGDTNVQNRRGLWPTDTALLFSFDAAFIQGRGIAQRLCWSEPSTQGSGFDPSTVKMASTSSSHLQEPAHQDDAGFLYTFSSSFNFCKPYQPKEPCSLN